MLSLNELHEGQKLNHSASHLTWLRTVHKNKAYKAAQIHSNDRVHS